MGMNVNTLPIQASTPMRTHSPNQRAFSLLELLVVILIIGIVAVFVTPAVTTILRGSQLSQAEQIVTDQIKLAHQYAVTKNRSIQVRFIRYGDPETPGEKKDVPTTGAYRAIQVFEILDSGAILPLDKPQLLPQSIVVNSGSLSTLISDTSMKVVTASKEKTPDGGGDPALPRGIDWNYQYVAFTFLRDGSTNLKATGVAWCVTLHNINEKSAISAPPANFVTLQVDPVSGSLRIFRPSV
jgi:uncharacterized protein (TIGR02596 family)